MTQTTPSDGVIASLPHPQTSLIGPPDPVPLIFQDSMNSSGYNSILNVGLWSWGKTYLGRLLVVVILGLGILRGGDLGRPLYLVWEYPDGDGLGNRSYFEVWESRNLNDPTGGWSIRARVWETWVLLGYTGSMEPMGFYKVRAVDSFTGLPGPWATVQR